ncbi:Cytochrome B561 [Caballeronia glathei]|uniref:Cytochrome n=1 Tax=Caballeronia glathei TaxID=60547 RepID=A0A069PPK8_9BURK|nr:cytochrome b [Caballeronia glathei]KDR42387.1 cytochrome [Caballeronia glathei]CDY79605.1 Cytochrome B561 [Caballeronia glathei]
MTNTEYTGVAKALHWMMALIVIVAWIVGYYSSTLPLSQKIETGSVTLHKAIATVTLFLLAARILWRLSHRTPEAPSTMSKRAQVAARAGHLLLYLCMFSLPLSGWAWTSAAGFTVPVAGLFHLPPIVATNASVAATLGAVHMTLAYTTAALVAGHILMAFKHHFVDRDGVLISMMPKTSRRSRN